GRITRLRARNRDRLGRGVEGLRCRCPYRRQSLGAIGETHVRVRAGRDVAGIAWIGYPIECAGRGQEQLGDRRIADRMREDTAHEQPVAPAAHSRREAPACRPGDTPPGDGILYVAHRAFQLSALHPGDSLLVGYQRDDGFSVDLARVVFTGNSRVSGHAIELITRLQGRVRLEIAGLPTMLVADVELHVLGTAQRQRQSAGQIYVDVLLGVDTHAGAVIDDVVGCLPAECVLPEKIDRHARIT